MKAKSYLLAFTLMLAGVLLVGCTKTTQATTTKKVDPTSQTTTKPTQGTTKAPTQPTQAPTQPTQKVKVDLAKPVVSVNQEGTGLQVAAVEHATKLQYSLDEAQFEDLAANGVIPFSTEAGAHSVVVKAVGNDDYNDSRSDAFAYTTAVPTITFTKTAMNSATVAFTGISLLKGDEAFAETTISSETTQEIEFTAKGGWDATNKIFYKQDVKASVLLTVEASGSQYIEKLGDQVAADLADNWVVEKYTDKWEASTATIVDNQDWNTFRFKFWNNNVGFRYTRELGVKDAYNTLFVGVRGNDVTNVTIRLFNSKSKVYVDYNLGVLPSVLSMFQISVYDSNWKLNYASQEYSLNNPQILAMAGLKDASEAFAYFDQIQFVVRGNVASGNNNAVLDFIEIQVQNVENAQTRVDREMATSNQFIGYYGTKTAVINLTSSTEGVMNPDYPSGQTLAFTYAIDDLDVNVTSVATGEGAFTLKLKLFQDGLSCKVVEATGAAQAFLNLTFSKPANFTKDWNDGTVGQAYNDRQWKQEQYTTSWVGITGQIRSKEKDGAKVINFYAANGMTHKYTYQLSSNQCGLVNYVSMKLGNYFAGAALKIKISVLDYSGNTVYLVGDANNFYEFEITTGLVDFAKYLDTPVMASAIVITIKGVNGQSYLYMDDMHAELSPMERESVGPNKPVVIVPVEYDEVHKIDFEDGAGSGAYASTKWNKEKYGNSGWEAGGSMNSRENGGSKIVNFVGGYSTTYRYTYTTGADLGEADHLSIKLGNWFSGGSEIGIKILVVDAANTEHKIYVAGTADNYANVPFNSAQTLNTVEFDFEKVHVGAIVIVVYSKLNGSAYLYCDDIVLGLTKAE